MNQTVWKIIPSSLNWKFREVCTDRWLNIHKKKESAWTNTVYIFFLKMMHYTQNNGRAETQL